MSISPRPKTLPVFMMARSWATSSLSLEAIGLLAKLAEDPGLTVEEACESAGCDSGQADWLLRELSTAGILVGDDLVDPASADYTPSSLPPAPRRTKTLVYYLQRADGAIKIGMSGQLDRRIFKLTDVYGELTLLATEIGAKREEEARHREFWKLRLPHDRRFDGGSEWFRPGQALLRHICSLGAAEVAA